MRAGTGDAEGGSDDDGHAGQFDVIDAEAGGVGGSAAVIGDDIERVDTLDERRALRNVERGESAEASGTDCEGLTIEKDASITIVRANIPGDRGGGDFGRIIDREDEAVAIVAGKDFGGVRARGDPAGVFVIRPPWRDWGAGGCVNGGAEGFRSRNQNPVGIGLTIFQRGAVGIDASIKHSELGLDDGKYAGSLLVTPRELLACTM